MEKTDKAPGVACAIDLLRQREALIESWLKENGAAEVGRQAHLEEGTPERLYWHYGYMIALRDVLTLLGGNASTPAH